MGEACLHYSGNLRPSHFALKPIPVAPQVQPWYALRVRTGAELSTAAALQNRGFDPYCPIRKEQRTYTDRMKSVDAPIFPGYVFCRFDAQQKTPILSSPGVQQIVKMGGAPAPIPEEQIWNIQRMIGAGATATGYLKQGQRVRVMRGLLAGVEGLLARDATGERLVVSVELLSRSVSLHIARDIVRSAECE